MFSNILDTVRIANENQLIAIEAFLMRSALSGTPAVLSPNQAIDSTAVQLITEGNIHNSKNHFIRAVELGIVKVAIPTGFRSMLDYCLDTLKRGEKDPNNEFIFSSMKFLYEKVDDKPVFEYNDRMEILNYIYTKLSEAKFRGRTIAAPASLNDEQKEMVERYISTIIQLDDAVRYYESFVSRKELIPVYIKELVYSRLSIAEPQTEIYEFLSLIKNRFGNTDWPIYRSFYYRLCEQYAHDYSSKTIEEFKMIIDICYNKVVALSIDDNAELNIAPDFSEVASIQASDNNTEHSIVTSSQIVDSAYEKLDWECLVDIYTEVSKICESTGNTWQDALGIYRGRQSRLPFVLSGKYALITSVTMAVSAIPVIGTITGNIVSEFMWNMICDVMGEVTKKPSLQDIVSMTQRAKKNTDMMDIVVTQTYRAG